MRWSVLKASEQLLVTGRNAALRCVLLVRVCCLLERCLYSWNLHCVCERACVVVPTPSFFVDVRVVISVSLPRCTLAYLKNHRSRLCGVSCAR